MQLRVIALVAAVPVVARADGNQCRVLDLSFAPATASDPANDALPQIVAWLETPDGAYVDTVYITQATGTYGIGNRPGRFDFNSGPLWPYGRRITTFPVWSHKQPLRWQELEFQDGNDSGLSHSVANSPHDAHFCRPTKGAELDALTCPTPNPNVDHGVFGANESTYPPRNDLTPVSADSPDVAMFATLNPFDAVSQPTPLAGVDAGWSYAIPPDVAAGDYVLWVEVSKEFDANDTYNEDVYPSPMVAFGDYGAPYRGQPSVVYRVPFTLAEGESEGRTIDYAGYGDPEGLDGNLRAPDDTISTTTGSGAGRLAILSAGGQPYRVRVVARAESDVVAPGAPVEPNVTDVSANRATIEFTAPGDDGLVGPVAGYEVRYLAGGTPITEGTFATAVPVTLDVAPVDPGALQTLTIGGLLPETDYSVAIRAFDNCRNTGPLVVVPVTTAGRTSGEVDACFVATAAYGSVLANDVHLLRRFRDAVLRRTALGELAVEAYYTFGPPAAGVIGESDLLRATARRVLAPIVDRVRGLR